MKELNIFNTYASKDFDVHFQKEAFLDSEVDIYHLRCGAEEIDAYVNDVVKPELTDFVDEQKAEIVSYHLDLEGNILSLSGTNVEASSVDLTDLALDDKYVSLNLQQNIAAVKTFTQNPVVSNNVAPAVMLQNTSVLFGNAPQEDQISGINFAESTGTILGSVQNKVGADASVVSSLSCSNLEATQSSEIAIGYDENGDVYTKAPTPATSDNSTKIATTAFVKGQGYTSNVGTVTSVNNNLPDANGNVTISISGTAWGSISGTLSDQTDLAHALAAKYDASNPDGFISGITSSDVTTALGYTPVNPSGLATVATSGDYEDLTNKPTIPTVNNATLTIQKNGTDVQTFTANASSNVTANITVPTKTSDLTNDDGFISGITSSDVTTALGYTPANSASLATVATTGDYDDLLDKPTLGTMAAESASDYTKTSGLAAVALSGAYSDLSGKPSLATVATSGSYNDLSNKPTIPTVNDATITLTQSGITKGSFTLNQSTNSTIELDSGLLTNVADVVGTYAELQAYSTTNLPSGSIVEVMVDENNSNKHSYYRWNDGPFVQPALTADGTIGGDSFACDMDSRYSSEVHYACWRAFDGRTVFNQYRQAITADGQPHWIEFYNPVPLVVTKMTVYNGYDTSLPLAWQFQCSDDNTTWTTIASGTNTNYTEGGEWSFDVANSGLHKYYRFYTTSGYGTNSGTLAISEFVITGHISGWTLVADEGHFTPTWGSITGTLSDQTDLANALAAKYDASNPSGYTSNVGTVTSVNNTSPDGNGNVTLSIPAAQVNSDWSANSGVAEILNKPTLGTMAAESASDYTKTSGLAAVALSGAYSDLSGTPSLATVATSGSYSDLSNKPTIPTTTDSVTSGSTAALTSGGAYTALQSYATTSAIANMQTTTNLVTSVSSSSTDSQYPSAKLFYDTCGDIETLINAL